MGKVAALLKIKLSTRQHSIFENCVMI